MDRLSSEEQKKASLRILIDIDNVCRKHGVNYFIAYGTLIGAIRHKGFIPWDDDIDLWVPLKEFDSFVSAIQHETSYLIYDHRVDKNWYKCFTKVSDPKTIMKDANGDDMALVPYGVSVDIFPLINCKKNEKWIKKIWNCKRNIALFGNQHLGKYKSLKYIRQNLLASLFLIVKHDEFYWKKKLYQLETMNQESDYIGSPISPYLGKDIHGKDTFAETCELEFEGYSFKAPVGWDEILTDIYGDYMKLPPEEKRVSNHEEIAYRL